MSDKPDQPQGEAQRDDLQEASVKMLNEIMDRSMPQIPDPPEEASEQNGEFPAAPPESEQSPSSDVSRETGKNKRSSIYIYLAVLFGAAFLMLLLAYFVQQRNSASVRDDLRTATASREELLEDIQQLEEENEKLRLDNDLREYETTQARELYESKRQEITEYDEWLSEARSQLTNSIVLGYLERFINEKDYLMAACVVEDCDYFFNEHNWMQPKNSAVLPTQTARYLELRNWLEDHGHVIIYQYSSNQDGNGATEQPVVALDKAVNTTQETRAAARNLWRIFWYYAESPSGEHMDAAAMLLADFYKPELGRSLDYLNTRNFQPSTIELFEQIKADLTDRGMLTEVDGVIKYAQDGVPIEIPVVLPDSDLIGDGSDPSHVSDIWKESTTVIYN